MGERAFADFIAQHKSVKHKYQNVLMQLWNKMQSILKSSIDGTKDGISYLTIVPVVRWL